MNVDDIRIRASDLRRQDEVRSVLQATHDGRTSFMTTTARSRKWPGFRHLRTPTFRFVGL